MRRRGKALATEGTRALAQDEKRRERLASAKRPAVKSAIVTGT
jgi:hypothetical protein